MMSWQTTVLKRLNSIEERRRMSGRQRLLHHPMTTLYNSFAMRLLNFLFRWGMSFTKTVDTVFDESMAVIVPTGYCDVWLYGAAVDCDAEARLTKFLLLHLQEGDTFFDIGACLGYYSLLASRLVGPTGSVHTFEPSPSAIPLLKRNLGGKPNTRIIEKAVSDGPGFSEFFVAPLPFIGTSSLRPDWQERKTNRVRVETLRLDDYCFSNNVFPNVINIDAEGVEPLVLEGAQKLLLRAGAPPVLILEVFTPLIDEDKKALQILKQLRFSPFAIREDGELQALDYAGLDSYLDALKQKYQVIQDSSNDFDNLVFKRSLSV